MDDKQKTEAGYQLLQCIHSYVVLDMYAALEVHTEETIAAGEAAFVEFEKLLKVFIHLLYFVLSSHYLYLEIY